MLTDVHSICGYVVAKFFYEKYLKDKTLVKPFSQLPRAAEVVGNTVVFKGRFQSLAKSQIPKNLQNWLSNTQFIHALHKNRPFFTKILSYFTSSNFLTKWISKLRDMFRNMSFEQKYYLVGALLANLPDFDVFLGKFFGGHHLFHRTLTHSIVGNAVIVPGVAYLIKRLFKDMLPYKHCVLLVASCVLSHLVTDFITNYGTGIFFPLNKNLYSYGIITVFDFTTVVFFYLVFTASRSNLFKQSNVMFYGIIAFVLLMLWKRAMLFESYSTAYHHMQALKEKHKGSTVWLHPCNYKNGRYHIVRIDSKTNSSFHAKTVEARPFLSLVQYVLQFTGYQDKDVRKVYLSETLDTLKMLNAPRHFMSYQLYKENYSLFKIVANSSLPTVAFIVLYHAISFVLYLRGSKREVSV